MKLNTTTIHATIQFTTGSGMWTVRKEFNNEQHIDNFIRYIMCTKGYYLDEVWY